MYYKKSFGERVSIFFICTIIIILSVAFLYPVIYCLSMSLSDPIQLGGQPIGIFPKGFSLEAYKYLLSSSKVFRYLSEQSVDELVNRAVQNESGKNHLFLGGSTSGKEINVIALTPMHMVTGEISVLFAVSLTIFVISAVFGIIGAIAIANHIYRPLYHAVELIEFSGNHSGEDEIKTIEHNVNEILEHNQAMTEVVTRSTPIVLETMFQRLITEGNRDDSFGEMLDMLSIEVRDGCYLAVVFDTEQDNGNMISAIHTAFRDNVITLFKRHKDEYVLILHLQQESFRTQVFKQCRLLKDGNAMIAVGKTYPNIYSIGDSYQDACRVLDCRKATADEGEIFDAESVGEYIAYELPSDIEGILYNYLISGNCPMVIDTIKTSLQKNLERGIRFQDYTKLVHVYELYLTRVYENMDTNAQKNIELSEYPKASVRMDSVQKRAETMLDNYAKLADFYHKSTQTDTMGQILQFIEDNMERDIGLEDVAKAVNLTANYIIKYFKNKTGINFKAYLTMKRMEKAKQLLTETEMTVKDIAEKCGYNSSKQLIANFSKATGLSPTEYRDCHR